MKHQARGNRRGKKPFHSKPTNNTAAADQDDPFFEAKQKRQRQRKEDDDVIDSESGDDVAGGDEDDVEEEEQESAHEVKFRLAKEMLEKVREITKREAEEEGDEEDDDERIAGFLHKKQMHESGRQQKRLADRVLSPDSQDGFQLLVKHQQPVTAVALHGDTMGFSASKDGSILHWDVESGKSEKYLWPSEDVLVAHHAKPLQSGNRSKHILALAVSLDGRYLASGGLDRHVHLWDVRTREHIQAFSGHKRAVSCLSFGKDSQLFSGSFDHNIMQWNAEDRTYMDVLYGHQEPILTIDSHIKERLLTVARDRTMHLWKIPEQSQLIFRAPASSLECCCFITDREYLSGSDDGSIELWSVLKKKPTHIVKNAHSLLPLNHRPHEVDEQTKHQENGSCKPNSFTKAQLWVSSVAVCRDSDLAASGAGNGAVQLWGIDTESRMLLRPLFSYPLEGFVNSLAIANSGTFLVAGVGRETRLGKWGRVRTARNGVAILPIKLNPEKTATV